MSRCSVCGEDIDPMTGFCARCGESAPVLCDNCGARRIEGTEFCPQCGASLRHPRIVRYGRGDNIALLLALLPGILGITGLGHIYRRHMVTGALLIVVGLGLRISLRFLTGDMELVALSLLLMFMAMYFWQVIDVMSETGCDD